MKDLKILGQVFNYHDFIIWVRELVAQNQTSGLNPTQELIKYTALNLKRMERINKTIQIQEHIQSSLNNNTSHQTWIIITEAWCGDSAQSLPVIAKIAEQSTGKIDLKIILRDWNPEWIEKYHTNGSKSIPKLIAFDQNGNELFTWGPRPMGAQEILMAWKTNPNGKSWDEFELELHSWYAKNKTTSTQNEIDEKLKTIEAAYNNLLIVD